MISRRSICEGGFTSKVMKTKKGKSKIKFKKILLFLLIVILAAFLLIFGAEKVIHLASRGADAEQGKPTYYLFIGEDEKAGGEADAMLLLADNDKKKEMTFISIPPNTKVIRQEKTNLLLKDTFKEGGAEETKSAVENLLHIRIDKYAVVNYADFRANMSKAGPISLYVEKYMEHLDQDGAFDIGLNQGYQSMDSEQALGYVRYVDKEDGEIGRIQRQERFLKILLSQLQSRMALRNFLTVRYGFSAIESDITPSDAASLAYRLTGYPPEGCKFIIFPGEMQTIGKVKTWVVNPVEAQKVLSLTMES